VTAYVVETTAAGTAAIAVLEVVGPDALDAISRAFGPGLVLPDRPLHTMISDGRGELDDVVLAFRPPEESMTGWPHVEIQCHGSPAIVKKVRRALVAVGVKPAPRTFLLRTAVRNRRMTRLEEEAWLAAMSALTERAANELWEQRKALPALAGRIGDARDRECLRRLIATRLYGTCLSRPHEIPVVGRPNAGKSSLINAYAGMERVLVDARPGTTRDLVRVPVSWDGIPFILIDTPGVRESTDPVEGAGSRLARRVAERGIVPLHLVDPGDPLGPSKDLPGFLIWTKSDQAQALPDEPEGISVSSVTGAGLDRLRHAVMVTLKANERRSENGAFLFTLRQVRRAEELLDAPDSEWQERWERWLWGPPRKPE